MDRDAWQTDLELGLPGSTAEVTQLWSFLFPRDTTIGQSNFDDEICTSAIVSGNDSLSSRQQGQMIGDGLWRRSGPSDLSLTVSSHNHTIRDSQVREEWQPWFEDEPRLDSEYGTSLVQAQIRALQNSPPSFEAPFQADSIPAVYKTYFPHLQGPDPVSQPLPLTTLFGSNRLRTDPFTASFEKYLGALQKETPVPNQDLPEAPQRLSTLIVNHDHGTTILPPIQQLEPRLAEESISFSMPSVPLSPSSVLLPELVPDIPLSILESDHGPHGRPTVESLSYTSISIADELAREAGVEASLKLESAMKASRNAINISRQAEAKLRTALDIFHRKQKQGQPDPLCQLELPPLSPIQGQSLSTKIPPIRTKSEGGRSGTGLILYLTGEKTPVNQYSAAAGHDVASVQLYHSSPVNAAGGSDDKSKTPKRAKHATSDLSKDHRPAIRLEDAPDLFGQDFLNQLILPSTFARAPPHNKPTQPLSGPLETSNLHGSTDVLMTESMHHPDRTSALNSLSRARDLRMDQQQLPTMISSGDTEMTTAATPLLDPAIAAQVQVKTDAIFRQTMQVCQKSAEEDQQANEAIRRFVLAFRQADHLRQVSSTSTSTSFYNLAPLPLSSPPPSKPFIS